MTAVACGGIGVLLLVLYCSREPGFLSCHGTTELQQTPRPPFCIEVQVSGSKATSLPSCSSETRKCNPYGSRILQPLTQNLPSRLSSNFEDLIERSAVSFSQIFAWFLPKPVERGRILVRHVKREPSDHVYLGQQTTFWVNTTFARNKKGSV